MAQKNVKHPSDVVERNLKLVQALMKYLYQNPRLFQSLPDDFDLIVLPDDDPEIRLFNLEVLDKSDRKDKPVVFSRIRASLSGTPNQWQPDLYAPEAA